MSRKWLFLIPGLLLAATACRPGQPATVRPVDAPVRVNVTSHFGLPVEIFAIGSGITQRLGVVHPGMSTSFEIPPNLVEGGTVVFVADPGRAARVYRSGELLLAPGTIVDFEVAQVLFNSTVTIRQ